MNPQPQLIGDIVKTNQHYLTCPMDYLENTSLSLCKLQDSATLEAQVEQLLQEENLLLLEQNAESFLVLSYVLSTTIRRVVFEPREIFFPNLLLLLPVLYHQLDWYHPGNDEWDKVHHETLLRFEGLPKMDEAVMLLFLEGMKYSMNDAMFMFQTRIALLTSLEQQAAKQLQWELTQYGWPKIDIRHSA